MNATATLTTSAPASKTSSAAPAAASTRAPRFDIYAPIHRALRLFMTDTLGRVGWLDTSDAAEVAATLGQLDGLLATCAGHLAHENAFVHPAIEASQPGGARRIADEHVEHLEEIAALQAEAATLRAAPSAQGANRLYRHLALFVAHNFVHMQQEETVHNELLWAACDDAQIAAIEQRIVASLPPEALAQTLRWMTPALPPAERAAWLGGMQQAMPPEAFRSVLDAARSTLNDTAWGKLARALKVPAAPGLMTA